MRANTQQQAEMDTESSNVRPCLAADPENTKMPVVVEFEQLAFMDSPYAKLSFNSRDERGSLK